MKIRIIITAVLMLLVGYTGNAQLTLDSCINMSYTHFEYEKQVQSYRSSAELEEKQIKTNWYPKFVLDANATYQNENISIPIEVPGIDPVVVPVSFNRVLVNFNQTIYDGSVTANQKRLAESKYSILEEKLETEKIQLKSKVISLYMSILLTGDNLGIIESKKEVVEERLIVLKGAEKYGTVPLINIRSLQAEILAINQQIIEIESISSTLYTQLSEVCGTQILPESNLQVPQPIIVFENNVDGRPEIQLLNKQIENFELQKGLVKSGRMPKINLYGSVGGGYPGFDIFKDETAFMGLVGIGFKWNIVDYGIAKNQKQILSINQEIAQYQQSRARTQFIGELKAEELEIEKQRRLLESDQEMIGLRKELSQMKSVQLDEGVATATDYLIELNFEEEAMLNAKIHELKLLLSQLNYLTIQGK